MVYDFFPILSGLWFNKIIYMYHHKARDPISLYFVFAMHITLTITFYLTLTINSSFINYFKINELISSLIKAMYLI